MVAVIGVVAAYGVANPSFAFATNVTGSNFEADDGNLVVNGGGAAIDWASTGITPKKDLPTGQTDDSFTGGTKNDSLVPTVDTGSVPNNKSDLQAFGTYVETEANDSFVNVFWTRVQDPNGTTAMDFEFNQSDVNNNEWGPKPAPPYPTEIIPTRTLGDLLVTYELANGGTVPTVMRRTWIKDPVDQKLKWGPADTFLPSQAVGSINTAAIPANQSALNLGALDARTFGEASISLKALVPDQTKCITFGSVYVKSRASDVLDEELKDFIAPEPTRVSNCASINIHKTESGRGPNPTALEGAEFTLYKDAVPVGGQRDPDVDDIPAGTCTTDGSGDCTINNVKKGPYWLVETKTPDGHDTAPDQHVDVTTGGQVFNLDFDDPVQHGHIIVIKNAVPDDPQDFTFTLDGGNGVTLDDDASLQLPGSSDHPNSHDYTVVVGEHTLAETNIPSGWVNTNLVCDDNNPTSVDKPTAVVNVSSGETVTCTYTDTYTPTAPGLSTDANVVQANTTWNDTATLTGDGTHAVTGSVAFYLCGPTATPTACAAGTQVGGSVNVVNGSATSASTSPAAAGNYCFRAVFTSSSPYYSSGVTHTNDTTECFLKQNADLTVTKTATAAFGRAYTWSIDKVVLGDSDVSVPAGTTHSFDYKVTVSNTSSDSTWTVTGSITVSNPNNVAFSGVDVTDAIDNGAGDCTVTGGSNAVVPAANGQVPGQLVLDYTCTYAQKPSPDFGTNTATATWNAGTYFTPGSSDTGTATVDFSTVEPSTTNQVVTVSDSLQGVLGVLDGATADNPTVYTYSIEQTAPEGTCTTFPNTAVVTAVVSGNNEGLAQAADVVTLDSASASVTLCGGLPLGIDASAAGSFDREYLWLIDKSVDQTKVTVDNGKSATFNYTVKVTPNGVADSGYELGGTVTVTNPNDFEDIVADVTVTSPDLGGGVACTVTGGDDVVIPQDGGEVTLDYTCTFSGTPALTGTVTATATWDPAAAATTDSSASKSLPVTLGIDTETNRTITVTDDKTDPANPVELGNATYDDGEASFTYSLVKEGVPGTAAGQGCADYTNVATIVETEQSDTQVVTLCHTFTGGGGTPVVKPPQGGGLPFTGDGIGLLARWSLGLILSGGLLLALSRKRRLV